MMIVLVACTNEPKDDGSDGDGITPPPTPPTDLTFIEKATGTRTVAGVEYVVDATTGDITVAGTAKYFYVSADATETDAVYSVTKDAPTEFLGANIYDAVFALYLKDRVDFWTTDAVENIYANELGGSANDSFVTGNQTVAVDIDNATSTPITYNVNEFTGHLTTAADADTIVYHYMGEAGTGQAYFRTADKTFLGLEVVEGTYRTYMENKTAFWATKAEVLFNRGHQVAAPPLVLGELWKKSVNSLPAKKDTFAALSFGDKIWLVGDNNDVYRSTDRGDTWTTVAANGLSDLGDTSGVALADDKLFVATKNNIYKSIDGGENWTSVHAVAGVSDSLKAIHVTASDNTTDVPNGIYFISGNGQVIYGDGIDGNWVQTAVTDIFPARESYGMGVAVHKSTLYIMAGWWGAGDLSSSANDVWKSIDGGKKWTKVVGVDATADRWSLRDRVSTVSTGTHVYLMAGGNGNSDVWRAEGDDLSVWTRVTKAGGYPAKNSAEAVFIPGTSGNKDRMLILGGNNSSTEVWYSEPE